MAEGRKNEWRGEQMTIEKRKRGRPPKDGHTMEIERKVRLTAEVDHALRDICKRRGYTIADGIRESIRLFLSN